MLLSTSAFQTLLSLNSKSFQTLYHLPFVSKLPEHLAYDKLLDFHASNAPFEPFLSGFKALHSTEVKSFDMVYVSHSRLGLL